MYFDIFTPTVLFTAFIKFSAEEISKLYYFISILLTKLF